MRHSTEGLVLKTVPYGDADLIVTFLTVDKGIRKGFAKSPRKLKARMGSSLEPLTQSRLSFYGREDAPLPRLTQADIIESFQCLREDYEGFKRICSMLELVMALVPESVECRAVYEAMLDTLMRLKGAGREGAGASAEAMVALFKIRLLEAKGYAPYLRGCIKCGEEEARHYTPALGAVLCRRCSASIRASDKHGGAGVMEVSAGAVKLYGALGGWPLEKIPRLRPSASMMGEIGGLLAAHIEQVIARPLRVRE